MALPEHDESRDPWLKRVGWLVVLWAGGVAGLALVAWLIRIFMNWAGFTT